MSSSQQDTYYSGLKALLSKSWRGNVTYGADVDFEKFEGTNLYMILPKQCRVVD
jgi:iron complex outermembrane receptor protein